MNKDQLRNELEVTLSRFYHLFSAIPGNLNTAPFEGSWTPAQLAQHLVLANGGCLEDINGPVQDTTRPVDAGVENIRSVFLDFSTKLDSPSFVMPPVIAYDKERQLLSLREIHSGLLSAAATLDLSQTCLLFELPVLGYLTRWEVLHFVLYHTQRHMEQLRKMNVAAQELEEKRD
jgi:hypothetical protein